MSYLVNIPPLSTYQTYVRLGTGDIDLSSTAKQTLFTVPTGRSAVITMIIIRDATAALVLGATGFGFDASAINVVAASTYTALTSSALYQKIQPLAGASKGSASDTFGAKPTVTQTGIITVDVFGYLV